MTALHPPSRGATAQPLPSASHQAASRAALSDVRASRRARRAGASSRSIGSATCAGVLTERKVSANRSSRGSIRPTQSPGPSSADQPTLSCGASATFERPESATRGAALPTRSAKAERGRPPA